MSNQTINLQEQKYLNKGVQVSEEDVRPIIIQLPKSMIYIRFAALFLFIAVPLPFLLAVIFTFTVQQAMMESSSRCIQEVKILNETNHPPIVDCEFINISNYSFVITVKDKSSKSIVCTGALIEPKWILLPYNCILEKNAIMREGRNCTIIKSYSLLNKLVLFKINEECSEGITPVMLKDNIDKGRNAFAIGLSRDGHHMLAQEVFVQDIEYKTSVFTCVLNNSHDCKPYNGSLLIQNGHLYGILVDEAADIFQKYLKLSIFSDTIKQIFGIQKENKTPVQID